MALLPAGGSRRNCAGCAGGAGEAVVAGAGVAVAERWARGAMHGVLCRAGHRAARRVHVHPQLLQAGKRRQNLSRGAGRGPCARTHVCARVPMCTPAVLSRPLAP